MQLPIRLFSVKKWIKDRILVFKHADDWNFCIISHTWGDVDPWTFECNGKEMKVTAFTKEHLTIASKCIKKLCFDWAWIDNICIDQSSAKEKQHEIQLMGHYYKNAKKCMIFTGGLHNIGDIIYENYSIPKWHCRIWTLQESLLSKDPVYLYKVDDIKKITVPTRLNKLAGRHIKVLKYWLLSDQYYFIIPHSSIENAISSSLDRIYAGTSIPTDKAKSIRNTLTSIKNNDWALPNIIRECGRRSTTKEEDIVYGILGLLKIENIAIEYEIGKERALLKLTEALHENIRPLLMICDFTHNAIPDFSYASIPYAAWGLNVDNCLASAHVLNKCMHTTANCADVSLERTGAGHNIRTGKIDEPSWPLEPLKVTTQNSTITCFGMMLKLKNNTIQKYTLILIGTNNKDWATNALGVKNVGICVAVNGCIDVKHKRGLLIVDIDKLEWTNQTIAVSLDCPPL